MAAEHEPERGGEKRGISQLRKYLQSLSRSHASLRLKEQVAEKKKVPEDELGETEDGAGNGWLP